MKTKISLEDYENAIKVVISLTGDVLELKNRVRQLEKKLEKKK